jgi:hypothetical protein
VSGVTATGSRAPRLLRPAAQATYERIFHTVYAGLAINVLLTVAASPFLLALAVVQDPLASWPFFAALSAVAAPALTGAFACFAQIGALDGPPAVLRLFVRTYRRTARQAMTCWLLGAVAVLVLAVDVVAVSGLAWGPALVPFFASAAVLVVAGVLAVLTVLAAAPPGAPLRLRDLARPCLYLAARRWYLALANVAVLTLATVAVLARPLPALLVACAPLLYVVWANTCFTVAPLLPAEGRSNADA